MELSRVEYSFFYGGNFSGYAGWEPSDLYFIVKR
jgi:hypothetical protein